MARGITMSTKMHPDSMSPCENPPAARCHAPTPASTRFTASSCIRQPKSPPAESRRPLRPSAGTSPVGCTDQRVLAPPPPRLRPRSAWPPHVPSGGVITSTSGRSASSAIECGAGDPPEAANWSRRHASVSKPVPSTMTTPAAPMRIACSAHQTRFGTGSGERVSSPATASRTKVKRSPPAPPANTGVPHCKAHARPSRDG